jgi:hypothetical protein
MTNDLPGELREAANWIYDQTSPCPDYEHLLELAANEIERLREIEWMYNDLCD